MNLDAMWMPFSANESFKANPRIITAAQGMYFTDNTGRQILDASASLWCVNAGHGNERIINAVTEQAKKLDYAPFFNMSHDIGFKAAERLVEMAPKGFDKVFFTNSGSESADTSLKIALAYHAARGETGRIKFIGREKGYHGVNFGGTSVGGIGFNRKAFNHLLPFVDHLRHTLDIERNGFTKGLPAYGAEWADELENRIFTLHDPKTIAAVIIEPMAGSAGVILPPQGYLQRIRDICTKHGILLIFDEVITGFGRTGGDWATNTMGVTPDILNCAKGITNGVVPMGAVLVGNGIYNTVVDAASEKTIEFAHGYTYSAHPLACAAMIATLDVYRDEGLFERAAQLSPVFEQAAHSLQGTPFVKDIRNIGLVAGVELETSSAGLGKRAGLVQQKCWEAGVLMRLTGETLAFSPPLIVNEAEIERIFSTLGQAITEVANQEAATV
ncbi:class 3 aminotransferase [Vitreoscilla sp. C1]|uniref:aspartate aminotransferase family protein n=1 Tax=Vitreoscilla sp. (strain C1) TaxID=96942 RepID=UPI000CDBC48A|nr:aspartate aminotransferase family protein [Vitreoscilla sp. C1]AUZ04490.1 class 3 aminotransferase [Vitreoscilla sp. C1]